MATTTKKAKTAGDEANNDDIFQYYITYYATPTRFMSQTCPHVETYCYLREPKCKVIERTAPIEKYEDVVEIATDLGGDVVIWDWKRM